MFIYLHTLSDQKKLLKLCLYEHVRRLTSCVAVRLSDMFSLTILMLNKVAVFTLLFCQLLVVLD